MKSGWPVVLLAAVLTPALIGCETGPRYGEVAVRDPHYSVRGVFTDHDRRLIHDYYAPRYKKLPPGQVKKGRLPPGHAWRARPNQPIHEDAQWRYLYMRWISAFRDCRPSMCASSSAPTW